MITAHHLVFGRKYGVDFDTFIYSEISGINGFLPVTKNGTVTFTTDRKGGNTAVQFGSGDLTTINNLPASPIWAFSFWIKTTDTSSLKAIIAINLVTKGNREFGIVLENGKIRAEINNAGVAYLNVGVAQGAVVNNNTWQHIVIILDSNQSAGNEIKIYINGILRTLLFNLNTKEIELFLLSSVNPKSILIIPLGNDTGIESKL